MKEFFAISMLVVGTIILGVLAVGLLTVGGCVMGWVNEANSVARDEVGARALLKKYQWFKEAAAQLDKKHADIKVYEGRFNQLKLAYVDVPRQKWAREDREQWNIWAGEVAGIKASYNSLAAEYNANMAKINWAFTNVGELPAGAAQVLPREFRTYEEN